MREKTFKEQIEEDFWSFRRLPVGAITFSLCLLAAQKSRKIIGDCRSILYFVPYRYLTEELCRVALSRNGDALQDIPKPLLTKELCELAVEHYGEAITVVPRAYCTRKLCNAAVREFGMALGGTPDEWKDMELARLALSTCPIALQFVPQRLRTDELYLYALRRDPARVRRMVPDDVLQRFSSPPVDTLELMVSAQKTSPPDTAWC